MNQRQTEVLRPPSPMNKNIANNLQENSDQITIIKEQISIKSGTNPIKQQIDQSVNFQDSQFSSLSSSECQEKITNNQNKPVSSNMIDGLLQISTFQTHQIEQIKIIKVDQIRNLKFEEMVDIMFQNVGNIKSILNIPFKKLGRIMEIYKFRKILFNQFNWNREQINFICMCFNQISKFKQWFRVYQQDNLFIQQYNLQKIASQENLRNEEEMQNNQFDNTQNFVNINSTNKLENNQSNNASNNYNQNQFNNNDNRKVSNQFYQKQKFYLGRIMNLLLENQQLKSQLFNQSLFINELKDKLKDQLENILRLNCELTEQKEENIKILQSQQSLIDETEVLILQSNKIGKSKIKNSINPQQYDQNYLSCDFIVQKFEWGTKRFNNKQAQYQGNINNNQLWKALIFDAIILNNNQKFLVIVIDPPWKRTGCKFNYLTQSNKFVFDSIPFDKLQDDGYVFLWVTNTQMEEAIQLMNSKGYEKCDILVWIKLNDDKTLYNNIGYYLRHIAEFCIIFRKKGQFKQLKQRTVLHFHSNILIEKAKKSCQKPESFYKLVEDLVPDHKYLDVFARECNQRDKWFSVGDQSIQMPPELRQ